MIPPSQILQLLKDNPDGVLFFKDSKGSYDMSHSDVPELWEIILQKGVKPPTKDGVFSIDLAPNWELHFKVLKQINRQRFTIYELIRIK